MRRVLALAVVTALAVVAIGATASAQRVTKFSVVAIQKSQRRVSNRSLISKGRLAQVGNLSNTVGHYHARFTFRRKTRTARIRAVAFFGRHTSLKAKGIQGPHDNRLPIIGGTGAFDGAAGKLKTRNLGRNRTLLTFAFVQ